MIYVKISSKTFLSSMSLPLILAVSSLTPSLAGAQEANSTINPELAAQATAPAASATDAAAAPQTPTLDSQLESLKIPENKAPTLITDEKLYSVQNRYANLKFRSEVTVGGAHNFTGSAFLRSSQIDLAYHFHVSNRWDVALSGSYGFSQLTRAADNLYKSKDILPDSTYVKNRVDLLVGYNFFYGKMRFSMERVSYFDVYLAAGPGRVTTQFGTATAAVADAGMAFWLGQRWSARVGVKNSFFKEQRVLNASNVYHMLGHLDVGVLFGGGA